MPSIRWYCSFPKYPFLYKTSACHQIFKSCKAPSWSPSPFLQTSPISPTDGLELWTMCICLPFLFHLFPLLSNISSTPKHYWIYHSRLPFPFRRTVRGADLFWMSRRHRVAPRILKFRVSRAHCVGVIQGFQSLRTRIPFILHCSINPPIHLFRSRVPRKSVQLRIPKKCLERWSHLFAVSLPSRRMRLSESREIEE